MSKFAIISIVAVVASVFFLTMAPSQDRELDAKFNDFLASYGRSYNSDSEYEFRRSVFKQNLEKAAELQKANSLASFGVTQFSDYTEEEFRQLLGERDDLEAGQQCVYTETSSTPVKDRTSQDWRKYFAPIQNQGSCGSCWSFATAATFEAYWNLRHNELIKASEQYLVDCDPYDSGCNGGLANNAYYFLSEDGHSFCTEDSYPYHAKDESCKSCDKTIGQTAGCHIVKRYDEDAIYQQITQGPVSISVDAGVWHSYQSGILTSCGQATNHAVVIVGYGSENGNDYWVVRNSWGTSWGENGYIRLAYGKNVCDLSKRPGFPIIN